MEHKETFEERLRVSLQYCVKSNKDRVVIVPDEFISMIHRQVLTSHLEDELTWICS